ncbi:MAG: tetratricopeptide repeat protein [Pyrinomonadaceae bacterium]
MRIVSVIQTLMMLIIAVGPNQTIAGSFSQASFVKRSLLQRTLIVKTQPRAVVWIDDVRRGVTNESGRLQVTLSNRPRQILRVRAAGFAEKTVVVPSASTIVLKLVPTRDDAELLFQQAEETREKAKDVSEREGAEKLYTRVLEKRPSFPAAHVGRARVLLDLNHYSAALDEIDKARKNRPVYAEASTVEGRILRMDADNKGAIAAFKRAIRESHGFQPEAFTGLGLAYEEDSQYEEAIAAFQKAATQLSDTEPVIYQLLGSAYEKVNKNSEAIVAYEKYLKLAPDSPLAPAIQSIIEGLHKPSLTP